MDPTDPWGAFAPANLEMCEETVSGLVAQPANTWSNAGFFVVAWLIARLGRQEHAPVARLLAPIAVATGVGSIAFHATGTLFGQLVDQSLMFLESSFFIVVNLRRAGVLGRAWSAVLLHVALVAGSTAALVVVPTAGIALFAAHVVGFLGLEAYLFVARREAPRKYGALAAVGACFTVSYAAWWLDHLRVVCDPDNHVFGGHAAWHLLGALSFYFWYRHYAAREGHWRTV